MSDERALLRKVGEKFSMLLEKDDTSLVSDPRVVVTGVTANEHEDQIYVTTSTGQLVTADINLKDNFKKNDEARFRYVMGPNHRDEITGLDVCIRKELLVTCSKDKSVNIWNYQTRKHELTHVFQEECFAVAFHPSGLHIIVALADKILTCNVLSKSLKPDKTLTIKGCQEIKFSHGGHQFACSANFKDVWIYDFYTTDCPVSMQFVGHVNKVRSIDWFENDMGFASCGLDGAIYFYDLYAYDRDAGKRNPDKDFSKRETKFTSLVNAPGKQYEVYAVGDDGAITTNFTSKKSNRANVDALGYTISQLAIYNTGKVLFAGVGDAKLPGAIEIWKTPLEKTNIIQAHSKPIEKMKMNLANTHLFTVGKDGMLCIFDIKDRDPQKSGMGFNMLQFSNEILTEKNEIDSYVNEQE